MAAERDLVFAASVDDAKRRLQLRLETSEYDAYHAALDHIKEHVGAGVTGILVDKQGYATTATLGAAWDFGVDLGRLLKGRDVKLAVVMDPNDHHAMAVCAIAMQNGGRILVSHDRREAEQWLDGDIC